MPNEQKDKIKIQLYVLYINGEETIDFIKTSIYTDFFYFFFVRFESMYLIQVGSTDSIIIVKLEFVYHFIIELHRRW